MNLFPFQRLVLRALVLILMHLGPRCSSASLETEMRHLQEEISAALGA